MPNVTAGSLIQLSFWEFSSIITFKNLNVIASSNFDRLFIKAEVKILKVNLCNYLWLRQSEFYNKWNREI